MVELSKIAACLKELGYKSLTELQKKSLKEILSNAGSIIIIAPTGSGKTEAAAFPVMLKIAAEKAAPVAAMYITPLRALNRDIAKRLEKIGKCFGIEVSIRHGDTPQKARKLIAENPPHILVTTPETFNYIVMDEKLRKRIENLKYIIIDEFREVIESKRGLLLLTVIYLLEKYLGRSVRKIALTATLSAENEEIAKKLLEPDGSVVVLRDSSVRELELEVVSPECSQDLCKKLSSELNDSRLAARIAAIYDYVNRHKHVLLFVNTRNLAEKLGALLSLLADKYGLGLKFEVHHGSLSRLHREKVEQEFKQGKLSALVATSSLELGIDIGHVNYVIQYMSPRQVVRLVQRVGRSRHRLGEPGRGSIISTRNILHVLESAVIAQKAKTGFIEKEIVHKSPLDVLAYAVTLYTLISREGVDVSELYNELKKHVLYSDLSFEDYERVIEYLKYARIVKEASGKLYPTSKSRLYLYKTSMIPSTKEIDVISMDKGERVGTLDEEYVILYLNPGDYVVLAGRLWKVIGYDDEYGKLYVEQAEASVEQAVVPHWEGENIPVEYDVAMEVGNVLKQIKEQKDMPSDFKQLVKYVELPSHISELGDSSVIYVDYISKSRLVIVNVYGGSRVNNLIKDLLKYVVRQTQPHLRFQIHATPYAVILRFADPVSRDFVMSVIYETIKQLHKYNEAGIIEKVVVESTAHLWRIYQVAQRFGAITPESTKVTRKLLEAFTDTVIGKEAVKEVISRDYDLQSFTRLADSIKRGKIEVVFRTYEELKEHHAAILDYAELPKSVGAVFDINSYYERLLSRRVTLLCLKCGFHKEGLVKEFMGLPSYSCPRCGYATLTVVKGDASEELELVKKLVKGAKLTPEENKKREDLVKRAVLLYRYGEKALLALAGRGVGTQEAIRIINKLAEGADLVSEIAECEKRFLMIKRYIVDKE